MTTIEELTTEAMEILTNAHNAMMREDITQDQYQEVKKNVLIEIGLQTEILTEG